MAKEEEKEEEAEEKMRDIRDGGGGGNMYYDDDERGRQCDCSLPRTCCFGGGDRYPSIRPKGQATGDPDSLQNLSLF